MVDLAGKSAKAVLENLRDWHETIKIKGLADTCVNPPLSPPEPPNRSIRRV